MLSRTLLLALTLGAPALARHHHHKHHEKVEPKVVKTQKYDALAALMGVRPDPDDDVELMPSPSPSPESSSHHHHTSHHHTTAEPPARLSCAEAEQKISAAYRESVNMRNTLKAQQGQANAALIKAQMSNHTVANSSAGVKLVSEAVKESFEKGLDLLDEYKTAELKNQTETQLITLTSTMYNTIIKKWHAIVVDAHNNQMLAQQNQELYMQAKAQVTDLEHKLNELHGMTEKYSECEEVSESK